MYIVIHQSHIRAIPQDDILTSNWYLFVILHVILFVVEKLDRSTVSIICIEKLYA